MMDAKKLELLRKVKATMSVKKAEGMHMMPGRMMMADKEMKPMGKSPMKIK